MGAPFVEAEQDSPIRIEDLPKIVMSRKGSRLTTAGASSDLCKRRFSLRRRLIWAVEKWESWFWISNFPRPTFKSSFWSFFFFG